ncbi:hypothetical protein MMC24_002580 [Lignoscripta atroalba]|nr:hypothetical protein [Lignoscripta atroalba]
MYAIETTERVASIFSLIGTTFIFFTFIISPALRKPINRLIFYASWGNTMYNVATLISQEGIKAGKNSPLCQIQGFLIQWCLPADALWNLAMAINVYLTVFRKYNAAQLRSLEWRYHLMCYGTSFIPALVYCFIETQSKGKVYGPATLWCWVTSDWDYLRFALLYGPAWVSIAVTFTMYILAGREIFAKRQQLRSFSHPSPTPTRSTSMVANPFVSFKTTEVRITSELVGLPAANSSQTSLHLDSKERIKSSHGYDQYSVTVETRPMSPGLEQPTRPPPTPGAQSMYNKHNNAAMEANTAAWAYTKTALLFFASLLITWVPSSINRVYGLAHPTHFSFGLHYAAGLVLPLMGFWNTVIYITTSWSAVKALFTGTAPLSFRSMSVVERSRVMSLDAKSREESGLRRKNRESDSMSDDINEI